MSNFNHIQVNKETLMENILPLVLADRSGKILMANAYFEQYLKCEIGSLENTQLEDLVENIDKTLFTPSFDTKLKNHTAWKTSLTFKPSPEIRIKSEVRIVSISIDDASTAGSFMILPGKVTMEKSSSKRLLRDKRILEEVNRNLNEGVYRSTETGKIIYANNAMLNMLGYATIDEIKKIHLSQVYVDPGKREQVLRKMEEKGEVVNEEVLLKRKDGSIFWGLLGTTRNVEEDGLVIYDGVVRDISAFKEVENRLREEKQKAEEAAIAKEQFLSMMSHELRTPLNAVIGISELLLRDNPSPHQIENLQTLQFSGENLLHLINDILDYSKVEAGMIEFETISFNLPDLLVKVFETFRVKSQSKELSYSLNLDSELPKTVKGDPTRLAQILNNLISNAFKFTYEGGIEISAIPLKTAGPDHRISIEVADTGIGIKRSKVRSIFDRFTQANSSTTREFGGTGLGLSITKKLVDLMGGNIVVKSEPGSGSKFRVDLFFEEDDSQSKMDDTLADSGDFSHLSILVVEDNKINQVVLEKYLTLWNAKVYLAANGNEALKVFKENDIDLVLMDLQMPELDGYSASQKILEYCQVKEIMPVPIIAVTASTVSEVKTKIEKSGMVDYVKKPFSPGELQKKITFHVAGLV